MMYFSIKNKTVKLFYFVVIKNIKIWMLHSLRFIVQMRIHTRYLIRGTARHSMVDWIIDVLFHARSIKQFDNGDENNIFIL